MSPNVGDRPTNSSYITLSAQRNETEAKQFKNSFETVLLQPKQNTAVTVGAFDLNISLCGQF